VSVADRPQDLRSAGEIVSDSVEGEKDENMK
jgi:hypothetical protein